MSELAQGYSTCCFCLLLTDLMDRTSWETEQRVGFTTYLEKLAHF